MSRADASGVLWYGTERMGTVHEWFDASGVRVGAVVQFDGYGTVVSGALSDRYGFTGREWDSVVGLQYSRARMYSPTQGRFTSEDPMGLRAGDANFYRYVGNQPTGRVDPSGLIAPFVAGGIIGGGIAALSYYATTPENERTSGGLAQAVAVGALSGALGGYVFGSYFAGAQAPVTAGLISRAAFVSNAYSYSLAYSLQKQIKGEAINLREYATGLAWSSMFSMGLAKLGLWFAQGGAEKAANGAKDILKGLRGQKCQVKPNVSAQNSASSASMDAANAARDEGFKRGAASALETSGGTFTGKSTGAGGGPVRPDVQAAYNAVPPELQSRYHGNCAEPRAISNALDAGVDPTGGTSFARLVAGPNHGDPKPACPSCQWVLNFFGIKDGAK